MRRLLLLLVLLPGAVHAQPADIANAIRTADWPTAQADAAAMADPVGVKLVTFYRLLHPGDAGAAEIAAFLTANPDWPNQAILLKRRDEALAREPDDATVLPLCNATPTVPTPRSADALARCAAAAAAAGHQDDATADAQAAWVAGFADASAEAAFLAQWQSVLRPADQVARFEALLDAHAAGAATQIARLAPADQAYARARLALRRGDPAAAAAVAALPAAQRHRPGLVLDELRNVQQARLDDNAMALWSAQGFAAEQAAGAPMTAAFWALRAQLARRRLRDGDANGAYLLADDTEQASPEAQADAAFLAGFIALRRLHQPQVAAAKFQLLARSSAAISQGRAHYWLARAASAAGDATAAGDEYARAAAWPTTFYGQLAVLAQPASGPSLNDRIAGLTDPGWTGQQALDFAGRELSRAAAMLVAWGDPPRARPFLQQIAVLADDPATLSMDAHFALGLGLPDQAVAVARLAGRDATMLAQAGWPMPVSPPERSVPAAVALGIIRQESSFNPTAVSPSGARGLMQLMPGTAQSLQAVGDDADTNMRGGTTYLSQLIDRFAGSLPLAIAAYNAGPSRVDEWLAENGDPRGSGEAAMIDWIELIPFAETRNYVQRVIEGIAVYRAKQHQALPYPLGA